MNTNIVKRIALLLALTVLLAGCGSETPEDVAGTVTPVESTTEAAKEASTEAVTEAPTEAPTEVATEPSQAENSVSLGRMEGGVYTNTYAGFGCELDSSWVYYSAEELQQLPENVEELLKDSEIGDSLANVEQITDMMAENADLLCNVNVLYQKLDFQSRLAYAMMTEEELVDGVLSQSDSMIAAYAQAGIEVTGLEKVKVTFLGQEHTAIRTVGSVQDVPVYMVQIFDYTRGSYSITLTLTSYLEDQSETMLALFYPVA